jgi:hypothetical protein|tara:strand:- start:5068 stop:5481 length:414 start_codon:yes stop_codon:yes gene_type:complete
MTKSVGKWKLPQPTDLQEDGEWLPIPRIARTIPFGYIQDEEDRDLLQPIPDQLNALQEAREYISQYSYREVANWLSTNTNRYISHVGLRKRLANEKQRKNKATSLRKWADYAEKAIEKAKSIEEERTGAKRSTETTH